MTRLATTTWSIPSGAAGMDAPAGVGTRGDAAGDPSTDRAPLAVLVHGVTSSSSTWWRVGPALAERGFAVLALDLRGHGGSPRGTSGMGIADLAADVAETVRAETAGSGTGTPAADGAPVADLLIGHSLGALTAMTLLAAEPGFARLVVLEEPPCQEAADWPAEADRIGRDVHLAQTDPDTLRAELRAPPGGLDEREADDKLDCLRALDLDTLTSILRGGMTFDVAAMARSVTIPALLFLGEPDRGSLLLGDARQATATSLAKGWTEVVPCGHSVHREAFDSFMRRLDAWLDRVGEPWGRPAG